MNNCVNIFKHCKPVAIIFSQELLCVSTILRLIDLNLHSSVSATIQLNLPTSAQAAAADPGKKSKNSQVNFWSQI